MQSEALAAPDALAPPPGRVPVAALRALAHGTGLLLAVRGPTFRVDANDRQVCRVVVTRRPHPGGAPTCVTGEADLDESFTGTPGWWDSTRATLAEVAEARALRAAFPQFSQVITED